MARTVLPPEKSIAFDMLEFQLTFSIAAQIDDSLNPESEPLHRFGCAVATRYLPLYPKKYYSFLWRYFALLDLLARGSLGKDFYRTKGTAGAWVHDAVISVAASCPLTKKGRFAKARFLTELRRRVPANEL